jgi:ABC-type transport system substrate-binding protein
VGVWAIETFGLPGDRYVTETLQDYMIFWFRQEADASMFMLRFGQADFISFEHHNH